MFDRRFPLADGSVIEQCDGTAWMAMLSLNLLQIAVELSVQEVEYADLCERFIFDFVQLAVTLNTVVTSQRTYLNWDEQDGFYYDVIKRPDGSWDYLRTRSVSGLIPLLAVASFDVETVMRLPSLDVRKTMAWYFRERISPTWMAGNIGLWNDDRLLLSLVPRDRLERICRYLLMKTSFSRPMASDPSLASMRSILTRSRRVETPRPWPIPLPTAPWRCLAETRTGGVRCGCPSTTS